MIDSLLIEVFCKSCEPEVVLPVKGQLISKCLFGVFNFLRKTNEIKSISGFIVVK